jgi:predicted amidohydrolase YtcJ
MEFDILIHIETNSYWLRFPLVKKFLLVIVILAVFGYSYYHVTTLSRHRATMLLTNGKIYTLDPNNSVASAIAIEGNRIVGIGTDEELLGRFGQVRTLDLQGRTVLPGLIDGHAHMYGLGELMQSVVLVGIGSPGEAVERVRERVRATPKGFWIYGRGWDQNLWVNKDFPTASQLDSVSPDHPVVLIRIDGHAIWVNSKAMAIAGVSRETKDPPGGKIVRYPDGKPTGVFIDNARDIIENKVPLPKPEEIEESILHAARECVKYGLTEVYDMGIDSVEIDIYKKLADQNKLPLRIYAAIGAPSLTWDSWKSREPLVGYGGGMFTLRAMKMYVDGALGSRGAALVEEYSDDPGNRGLTINDDQLEPQIKIAVERGYQPCVHAIGDRGNHIVLDVYEKILKSRPVSDVRPRIEHAQVLLPDDIQRFKVLNILPSMQPVHATSDMPWAESRLGPRRILSAYAWRAILNTGSIIIGGSDFPNDGMNPLWGIYAAITRTDHEGNPRGGWYPDQCMSREEALRAYTQWAAFGGFEEKVKGTLEVGKLADLTVLSKDIMKIQPAEILSTSVDLTMVNGKVVYERAGQSP